MEDMCSAIVEISLDQKKIFKQSSVVFETTGGGWAGVMKRSNGGGKFVYGTAAAIAEMGLGYLDSKAVGRTIPCRP